MIKNLTYDLETTYMFRQVIEMVRIHYPDRPIDTRYMDHLNDICPRCKRKLRVLGRRVQGVESVSCVPDSETDTFVVYGVCKPCAKEIENKPNYSNCIEYKREPFGNRRS